MELASYGYDSQNRRIRKTANGRTVYYHYDLDNQLLAETLADGTPLREYVYLDGEPLAVRVHDINPGMYFYVNDHLGTPQQLVNLSREVVWKAAYLPFGAAQVRVGAITNNLRFPGQYYDAETGLHYNWNRYYNPAIGRYISADPVGLEGGMNLYAYVDNDPVNWSDPNGLTRFQFAAGVHLPIRLYPVSAGVTAGNLGGGPEVTFGSYYDAGVMIGVGDFSDECGKNAGNVIGFGLGRYAGIQLTLRKNAQLFHPSTWIDGITAGLGIAIASPITLTVPLPQNGK